MFVGEFERSVDANGRLTLPSTFRDELGDTACYLTRDNRGCLVLTPRGEFESQARALLDKIDRGEVPRSAKQDHGVTTTLIAVDRQGRLTLDDETRSYAGIRAGRTVTMAGTLDTIEIWRDTRYATVRSERPDEETPRQWDDGDDDGGDGGDG